MRGGQVRSLFQAVVSFAERTWARLMQAGRGSLNTSCAEAVRHVARTSSGLLAARRGCGLVGDSGQSCRGARHRSLAGLCRGLVDCREPPTRLVAVGARRRASLDMPRSRGQRLAYLSALVLAAVDRPGTLPPVPLRPSSTCGDRRRPGDGLEGNRSRRRPAVDGDERRALVSTRPNRFGRNRVGLVFQTLPAEPARTRPVLVGHCFCRLLVRPVVGRLVVACRLPHQLLGVLPLARLHRTLGHDGHAPLPTALVAASFPAAQHLGALRTP